MTQVAKAWTDKSRVELRSRGNVRSASPPSVSRLGLRLTPHGRLLLEQTDDAPDLEVGRAARLVDAFARGSGPGLVQLGAGEVGQALPPVLGWWRGICRALCDVVVPACSRQWRGCLVSVCPARCRGARCSGTLHSRADGTHDAGVRVSDVRSPAGAVGGDGNGGIYCICRSQNGSAELSERP